ncbi:MAG TPA: rhodanese-like domain-containing protein [bacterium]|nr:rhodanese-like domain-containing protein [bacterium]
MTADWLAGHLDDAGVVVIDTRSTPSYRAGHVPGAVSFPPESAPEVGSLPELVRLPQLLGGLGLTGRERLVCCGEISYSGEASRVFWLLEAAGAGRVMMLEGGFAAWRLSGRRVEFADSPRAPVEWAPSPNEERLATSEYVRRSFGEAGVEILDARGPDAWRGPLPRADWGAQRRVGHIPHALPLDLTAFFEPGGTFLGLSETWAHFTSLGPRPANPVDVSSEFVVHGWGEGHQADPGQPGAYSGGEGALAYFLLRRAGVERVRLYTRGWSDWYGDPYLPVVRIVTADELMYRLGKSQRWLRPKAPPGNFAFFDVRHPADHTRSHIRGSVALRSDHFADSLDIKLEQFWPDIDRATTPVVTYCYGEQCIRSRATSTAAARGGFIYIERFYGGLDEWLAAGGSVVREE